MLNEKISVIVPIYNSEKYLNQCLKSISNQRYENIEVLMVNDGSTDNSASICRDYEQSDKRFILIDKKNGGSCSARNVGLKYVSGSYVSFIDSDDYIDPNFLSILHSMIALSGAQIAQCNFRNNSYKEFPDWKDNTLENKEIIKAFLDGEICNRIMNKLYRTEVIKDVFFPEDRCVKEDAYWTAMVLKKCNRFISTSEAYYYYRIINQSLSHRRMNQVEKCGSYRNDLDKMKIILSVIPQNENPEIEKKIQEIAHEALLSFCDLTIFNIYEIFRLYYLDNKSECWVGDLFRGQCDYKIAQKKYLIKVLLSCKISMKKKARYLVRVVEKNVRDW